VSATVIPIQSEGQPEDSGQQGFSRSPNVRKVSGADDGSQPTELAFATRIHADGQASPPQATAPARPNLQNANTTPPAAKPVTARVDDEIPGRNAASANSPAASPQEVSVPAGTDTLTPRSPKTDNLAPHHAELQLSEPQATAPAAPMKDLSFHIGKAGEKVEVRLVEQGGEVRIAVHAGDSELTRGLRQGISELSGKLQENGYRAQMWHPGGAVEAVSPGSETRHASDHTRDGQSQSQSGGSQQDRGRQNQNGSDKPRWVEEMESSLNENPRFTGVSNGIAN
jgi:hypothetical protein